MNKNIFDRAGGLTNIALIGTILISIVFLGILVYSKKDDLNSTEEEIVTYAEEIGLDRQKFIEDFKSEEIRKKVEEKKQAASERLNNQIATPTIFLEGEKVNLTSLDDVNVAIDKALEEREDESSPITLEVFSDFNCSACSRFDPLTYELDSEYGDDLVIQRENLPFLKDSSYLYAYAAMAAKEQGKYDEMGRKLFSENFGVEYNIDINE